MVRYCTIGVVVVFGLATVARSQETDAPTTQPADAEPHGAKDELMRLRFSDLYLGFESDVETRRVRSTRSGRPDSLHKNNDLRFKEYVGLRLDGDVLDPNLLSFDLGGEFGLTQSRFRETIDRDTQTENDDGFLGDFNLSFDALSNKPVSFHGHARRSDDRIDRRFLPSLREQRTEMGVSSLIQTDSVTTELGLSWDDVERYGNQSGEDDETLDTKRAYISSTWDIAENHRLKLNYDHEREENTYQGSNFDYQTNRDELRLDHELAFGGQDQHRMDTYLRINDERGDLARDEVDFVPRLSLQHTEDFRTIWRYGFYRYEDGDFELDQHKVDGEALWQVTDELRATLDGFLLYERPDDGLDVDEYGGGLDLDYGKDTSLGRLTVNAAAAFEQQRFRGGGGLRFVRNEVHQLGGVRLAQLNNWPVRRGSIVAYNTSRTRFYVNGIDYQAVFVGGRALIDRIPTGRITEGEAVHFDYAYEIPAGSRLDTWRTDLLVEHAFEFGLTPYYYLEGRFQDADGSIGTPILRDNQARHRAGARYERDLWRVGAEYELFDDTVEPFDAFHLTGQASLFRSSAHTLDATTELSRYDFDGGTDARNVWWFDAALRDRAQITEYLAGFANVEYRFEDDSRDGDTHGVDLACGLSYTRGQLTLELTVEYDLLNIGTNHESGVGVYLNMRRSLTELLPSQEVTR